MRDKIKQHCPFCDNGSAIERLLNHNAMVIGSLVISGFKKNSPEERLYESMLEAARTLYKGLNKETKTS